LKTTEILDKAIISSNMTGKYLNEKNEAAITSNIIKENCPRGIEQSSIGCTVKKLLV